MILKTSLWIVFFVHSCLLINAQESNNFPAVEEKNQIQNTENNPLWERFAEKVNRLKNERKGQISIVHLGDSHIQGGYLTNRFRELLAKKYGISGRGFIFPYSLVKTNGPEDVKFSSSSAWSGYKYTLNAQGNKAGISGYDLACRDTLAMLSFSLKQGSDSLFPFDELVVYHKENGLKVVSGSGAKTFVLPLATDLTATHLVFDKPFTENSILFRSSSGLKLDGLELRSNTAGIRYHAIGINGLTYDAYLNSINYLSALKALQPDCIIISLGTNDAYVKRLDPIVFKTKIEKLITGLKKEFPDCCILLTTPGDHLFNRHQLNPNLVKVQSSIILTANEQHCVYWDFLSVMGGLGSSKKWAQYGGMYKDIVHLSKQGYKWQGEIFFEAFDKAIESAVVH